MVAEPQDTPQKDAKAKPTSKIIKRYSNRKLYDTERSKYVTLEEIADMIKAGDEVTIIDNKSKADLTSATLAQIIFENEKRDSRMPLGMLRNLIQTSGEALNEFFDKQVKTPVERAQHSAQKTAEEIMQGAAQLRQAATRGVSELTTTARRVFGRGHSDAVDKKVDALARRYEGAFDELKKRIEVQVREAPNDGPQVVEPLIERLSERLDEIKTQLSKLHAASLSAPKPGTAEPAAKPPTSETTEES